MNKRFSALIYLSLIAVFITMGVFYSFFGRVFLDAGFYLNAAREVYQGKMPYRDFFFVQGPIYPYVYGFPLMFTGYKLLYARWLSLIFGSIAIALAGWTAFRSGGRFGALIALTALTTVPVHAYYFSSVKLYSLAAMLITGAFAILASRCNPTRRYTTAIILTILAAATRLTLVPVILVVTIFIIVDSYALERRFPWQAVFAGAVVGLAVSLPFLIAHADAVIYYLIGIHTSASEGPFKFTPFKQVKVIAKIILYYPILTVGLLYVLQKLPKKSHRMSLTRLDWAMAASILAVTAVHLTANWFSVGYQSVIMPLSACFVGGLSGRWLSWDRIPGKVLLLSYILIISIGLATWKQNIWMESLTVHRNLEFVSEVIHHKSPENSAIAGCSAVFALQAGRPVAGEFGGAPFTYTPLWSDEHCRRYGGMNNAILIDLLKRKEAGVLLFETNSFSMGSPGFFPVPESMQAEIFKVIDEHYVVAARLRNLGNGNDDLIMYVPKTSDGAP